jgi:hypothetical protein
MDIAGRPPGGRPLRRSRVMELIQGRPRLRGTAARQARTDDRCDERMAIIGRGPGGRPLRRRRETGVDLGPATAAPIIIAPTGWPLLAEPLEGVRSVGAVEWS